MNEDSHLEAAYEERTELRDEDYAGFDQWLDEYGYELDDSDLDYLAARYDD